MGDTDPTATPSNDLMPDNCKMRRALFFLPSFFPKIGFGRNLSGKVTEMDTASPILCLDFTSGSVEVQGKMLQGDTHLPE